MGGWPLLGFDFEVIKNRSSGGVPMDGPDVRKWACVSPDHISRYEIKQDFKRLNLCVFRFKMPYYVDIRSLLGYNKLVKLILSCFAYKICKTI